jgi:hypothetical protein
MAAGCDNRFVGDTFFVVITAVAAVLGIAGVARMLLGKGKG